MTHVVFGLGRVTLFGVSGTNHSSAHIEHSPSVTQLWVGRDCLTNLFGGYRTNRSFFVLRVTFLMFSFIRRFMLGIPMRL